MYTCFDLKSNEHVYFGHSLAFCKNNTKYFKKIRFFQKKMYLYIYIYSFFFFIIFYFV